MYDYVFKWNIEMSYFQLLKTWKKSNFKDSLYFIE